MGQEDPRMGQRMQMTNRCLKFLKKKKKKKSSNWTALCAYAHKYTYVNTIIHGPWTMTSTINKQLREHYFVIKCI